MSLTAEQQRARRKARRLGLDLPPLPVVEWHREPVTIDVFDAYWSDLIKKSLRKA